MGDKKVDSRIISYIDGDEPILVVGKRREGNYIPEVLNAFKGEKARHIWEELNGLYGRSGGDIQ